MANYYRQIQGEKNRRVVFLLAGWLVPAWLLWPVAKILQLQGYCCITYTYDEDILSPDGKKTVESILAVRNAILAEITLLKRRGYNDIYLFGTSLGSLIALLVANKSEAVSKVIFNIPGIDIAKSVWKWDKIIPNFKNELIKQDYTLKKLKKEWRPIAPIRNINNLRNKQILLLLTKKDEIVYCPNQKLIRILQKQRYQVKAVISPGWGHYLSGIYHFCRPSIYLNFLKS